MDKELERRGHCFARYADDANVYVRSVIFKLADALGTLPSDILRQVEEELGKA